MIDIAHMGGFVCESKDNITGCLLEYLAFLFFFQIFFFFFFLLSESIALFGKKVNPSTHNAAFWRSKDL